tara:strand:- start:1806 stop:2207 length:402 start_codon:yes stop_codon:yes gene_type:complete
MKLKLKHNKVTSISLIDKIDVEIYDELSEFKLGYEPEFLEDGSTFKITFDLNLKIQDEKFLMLKFESTFEFEGMQDFETFKNSKFPVVNAPAIAFPFLRSFVGTFLLNAGYEPILLPSFNFSAMHASSLDDSK